MARQRQQIGNMFGNARQKNCDKKGKTFVQRGKTICMGLPLTQVFTFLSQFIYLYKGKQWGEMFVEVSRLKVGLIIEASF